MAIKCEKSKQKNHSEFLCKPIKRANLVFAHSWFLQLWHETHKNKLNLLRSMKMLRDLTTTTTATHYQSEYDGSHTETLSAQTHTINGQRSTYIYNVIWNVQTSSLWRAIQTAHVTVTMWMHVFGRFVRLYVFFPPLLSFFCVSCKMSIFLCLAFAISIAIALLLTCRSNSAYSHSKSMRTSHWVTSIDSLNNL